MEIIIHVLLATLVPETAASHFGDAEQAKIARRGGANGGIEGRHMISYIDGWRPVPRWINRNPPAVTARTKAQ